MDAIRDKSQPDKFRKEMLADAIAEEKKLRICQKHLRAVWYDAKTCPACQAEKEFDRIYSNHDAVADVAAGE